MFELMKPMLVAMLVKAASMMDAKSRENVQRMGAYPETSPHYVGLVCRAGIWADAADMIRQSIAS